MKGSSVLQACWIYALQRASGQAPPMWLDLWNIGFRSPWKA